MARDEPALRTPPADLERLVVHIVPFESRYAEAFVALVVDTLREFGFEPDPVLDQDLEDPAATYAALWLAIVGGKVVGSVALRHLGGDAYELKRMYLGSAHRGRGVGKRLLATALDWARANHARSVRLDTSERRLRPDISTSPQVSCGCRARRRGRDSSGCCTSSGCVNRDLCDQPRGVRRVHGPLRGPARAAPDRLSGRSTGRARARRRLRAGIADRGARSARRAGACRGDRSIRALRGGKRRTSSCCRRSGRRGGVAAVARRHVRSSARPARRELHVGRG